MLDDVVKFFVKFFEKNIDNLLVGTSRFWDNFLARVATISAIRFLTQKSEDGEVVLQSWVIPTVLLVIAFIGLGVVLMRRLDAK